MGAGAVCAMTRSDKKLRRPRLMRTAPIGARRGCSALDTRSPSTVCRVCAQAGHACPSEGRGGASITALRQVLLSPERLMDSLRRRAIVQRKRYADQRAPGTVPGNRAGSAKPCRESEQSVCAGPGRALTFSRGAGTRVDHPVRHAALARRPASMHAALQGIERFFAQSQARRRDRAQVVEGAAGLAPASAQTSS